MRRACRVGCGWEKRCEREVGDINGTVLDDMLSKGSRRGSQW